jgi:hypothetical protein
MGRRLPDEVVYRIRVGIEAGEGVPAIAKAIGAHRTVYKIRANLDLYGEPYAPASVVQGRPSPPAPPPPHPHLQYWAGQLAVG